MTRTSKIAYLASVLDGDGSISISIITRKDWEGYSFQPYIAVGVTSRSLCKWAQEHFGGNLYGYDQKNGHQKMYHWKLYGKNAVSDLLNELLPYLFVKKDAAKVVLEYMALGSTPNQEARLVLARKAQETNAVNHLTAGTRNLNQRETNAYLAGLIDTEGAIGIRDNRGEAFGAYIMVNNTNKALIDWVAGLFPGNQYTHRYSDPNYRDNNLWSLYGKQNIEHFLLSILPYLIIKRELANTILQFVRLENTWNKELRQKLFEQAKSLQVRNCTQTTNTTDTSSSEVMIESEPTGDCGSALQVTAVA